MKSTISILLVEDDAQDRLLVEKHLAREKAYTIESVTTIADASEALSRSTFDAILTDLGLPDSQGIATLRRLVNQAGNTPIVVLTGIDDPDFSSRLVAEGAQDYIPKSGLGSSTLHRHLRHALARHRVLTDAKHAALHDGLTGLPNRTYFSNHLQHTLLDAQRRNEHVAVVYIDIDKFKPVNDNHGHAVGDELLKQVADRLSEDVRKSDVVARLGGDEFAWVMPTFNDLPTALNRVERMMSRLNTPYVLAKDGGAEVHASISASIGVSLFPDHADSGDELIKLADQAMYCAKRRGGSIVQLYSPLLEGGDNGAVEQAPPDRQTTLIPSGRARVLMVEDDPQDRLLIEKAAGAALSGIELDHAGDLEAALQMLGLHAYDAVLLDLGLPDCKGLETVKRIRTATPGAPIVVLTASPEDPSGIRAIQAGAQDFIAKTLPEMRFWVRAIRYAIEREALIQQRFEAVRRAQVANIDLLTELPNRREFQASLKEHLLAWKLDQKPFFLAIIDLVDFQKINDHHGYAGGDKVLQTVGQRLARLAQESSFIARLGGDEFAAIIPMRDGWEEVKQELKTVLTSLHQQIRLAGGNVRVGVRMGVTHCPSDGDCASELMRNADLALRRARIDACKGICRYSSEIGDEKTQSIKTENMLRGTLNEGGIKLVFQPIVEAGTGRLRCLEALLRWRHPEGFLLSPGQFLGVAEESGLIVQIDSLVLREVCRLCAEWLPTARASYPDLSISVNVSNQTINSTDYAETLGWLIDEYGLVDTIPVIEVTETALANNMERTIEQINRIGGLGALVAIDDFGAEFSSLNYLKKFRYDKLKIDRAFISSLPDDESDRIVVDGIMGIAEGLGLEVVVEGVETSAQVGFFAERDTPVCLQGFHIERPIDLADICERYRIPHALFRRTG